MNASIVYSTTVDGTIGSTSHVLPGLPNLTSSVSEGGSATCGCNACTAAVLDHLTV